MLRVALKPFLLLLMMSGLCIAESFPYTAYVTLDSTSVRSGPGDSFYPTNRLRWAAPVEVYRHDNKRWAAIRPPLNSYSWVSADAIERSTSDRSVGRVVKSKVKTRIGSTINADHRGVEYITLNVGESVDIRDDQTAGGVAWYRIAPPAGEFRWIRLSDISQDDPTVATEDTSSNLTLVPDAEQEIDEDESTELVPIELAQFEGNSPDDSVGTLNGANESPAPALTLPPATFNDNLAPSVSLGDPVGAESLMVEEPVMGSLSDSTIVPMTAIPRQPPAMIKPGPVAKKLLTNELSDIELQLSLTVSQPAAAWDMAPLRIRTQALIDTSDEPEVRSRATELLSKIARFADIQRRQVSVDNEVAQFAQSVAGPSVLASTYGGGQFYGDPWYTGTNIPGSVAVNGYDGSSSVASSSTYNYDGTGWLMPVVTDRNDMPKYVLTDSKGDVLQFVSPRPGMSLKEYETKQVGIIGSKQKLKDTNESHIVADRVISLDKVRR